MQAVEERARAFVEKAVEAAEAASRDANMWREKHQQQTNKMAQLEQKVRHPPVTAEGLQQVS
eukprot:1152828-Pelagomonas_calceolata.AAC.3